MAVKAKLTVEEFGKLTPEALAAMKLLGMEYIDVDGDRLLKVDAVGGYSLENRDELQAALNKERGLREKAEAKLTAWGDYDPDRVKKDQGRLKEMETWVPDDKAKKQLESALAQLDEKYKPQLVERDTKLASYRAQLEEAMIDSVAKQAIIEAKGRSVRALLPHVKSGVKMVEKDGKFSVRVVNEDGTEKYSKVGKLTEPMTIKELVESMRAEPDFQPFFEGTGVQGSGAQPRNNSGGNGRFTVSASAARENPNLYATAKAQAEAAGAQVELTN